MKNIVLIGIMGSGKTTVGKALAKKLGYPFIDADDYLEDKYEMSIPDMFEISEEYFRDRESECCRDFAKLTKTVIATGGGVIKRDKNIDALRKNSIIFYVDRPIENIVNDVDTSGRPLLKEGADKLYALDRERRAMYQKAGDVHLINDGTVDDIVNRIADYVETHRKEQES